MRKSLLCRIGLHRYPPFTPSGVPPMFIMRHCERPGCTAPMDIQGNWVRP